MNDRKYYIDETRTYLVKAYAEGDKFVLEMISLTPKYRRGYHRNVFRKTFDTAEYANNYFKKVKENNKLTKTTLPVMANKHMEF